MFPALASIMDPSPVLRVELPKELFWNLPEFAMPYPRHVSDREEPSAVEDQLRHWARLPFSLSWLIIQPIQFARFHFVLFGTAACAGRPFHF